MILRDRIEYLLCKPLYKQLFEQLAIVSLSDAAKELSLEPADVSVFVKGMFEHKYSKVRSNPLDFRRPFGKKKIEMVLRMAKLASKLYDIPLIKIPELGRHEIKYKVRDTFSAADSVADTRQKWGKRDIVFWNIMAGLKWERNLFNPGILKGANILDYGCNIGALSYLARKSGAESMTLVDVPGETLNFAGKINAGKCKVVEAIDPVAPIKGPFDVAYCCHVLEHLPDPLGAVERIHAELKTGGTFYTTFIALPETEGGCNLIEAQKARTAVINFLQKRFDIQYWNEKRTHYVLRKIAS